MSTSPSHAASNWNSCNIDHQDGRSNELDAECRHRATSRLYQQRLFAAFAQEVRSRG